MTEQTDPVVEYKGRRRFLLLVLMAAMLTLLGRAVDLQVLDRNFLKHQGDLRHIAVVPVSAYRGKIMDRYGEPLAISTPMQSVCINPQEFEANDRKIKNLAQWLGISPEHIRKQANSERSFAYLKRRVDPALAERAKSLGIAGLFLEREFRRFYPAGEVTAHVVGFTDIDDRGQEGLELAYDHWLKGTPGKKRILRDGKQQIIEDVENIQSPAAGKDLWLSLDQRLQYLAYRELKAAVLRHRARAGSLVLMDARTGEILAMVNQPSFNPNSRRGLKGSRYRNRAITDVFEPGSTIKPFAVACALELGLFKVNSVIDTSPGILRVGRNVVRDLHNYGRLDIPHILQKSSNVGVSKIALSLAPDQFWGFYNQLGFGQPVGIGFPGEASGRLLDFHSWHRFEQATLAFGYGLSTSAVQLVRAYSTLADDGLLHTVSLLKREKDEDARRLISASTAIDIRQMLEQVVSREGTALKAGVAGYRIAGKTGTVKKVGPTGYADDRYFSLFIGMAPASDPRLILLVTIDEPSMGDYYGGAVAAPVFSQVMGEALRLLGVAPDQEETMPLLIANQGGSV